MSRERRKGPAGNQSGTDMMEPLEGGQGHTEGSVHPTSQPRRHLRRMLRLLGLPS